MKRKIIGTIGIIVAIALAIVINSNCQHTNFLWQAKMYYLIALFLFHACWCAMCVTEKRGNDIFSVIGANVGLPALIFCIIIAFINIEWWIVLLFIPFTWLVAGRAGGKAAQYMSTGLIGLFAAVGLFAFMVHVFYKF